MDDANRPCRCDNAPTGEPYRRGVHCARCWLWKNHPPSRLAFGRPATAVIVSIEQIGRRCIYEGAIVERAPCDCAGRHVRFCDHPEQGNGIVPEMDRCVRDYRPELLVQDCERCPWKVAPPQPETADV